jgi:hypothetical protein
MGVLPFWLLVVGAIGVWGDRPADARDPVRSRTEAMIRVTVSCWPDNQRDATEGTR